MPLQLHFGKYGDNTGLRCPKIAVLTRNGHNRTPYINVDGINIPVWRVISKGSKILSLKNKRLDVFLTVSDNRLHFWPKIAKSA